MRYGFLSTYPPTQCGLATFNRALATAMSEAGASIAVVRSLETPHADPVPDVVGHLVAGDQVSQRRAAELLNACDVAVIQHEYGIYGGTDGSEVLEVMRALRVPTIVVAHTVLVTPTESERRVLEGVAARADAVVTMTMAARDRLLAHYRVSAEKVHVIPHGAVPAAQALDADESSPRVLTWGLLGPGKGIEWGVEAMAHLRDLDPTPHYLIAGETHPKVVAKHGEAYREGLMQRAQELGIADMVRFDDTYRPTSEIPALVASADVVLLPYDSTEQVTSGVLIEAVAAGRPVIATRFPHAEELLADGVGITVPHRDPGAIAEALRSLLTDGAAAERMRRTAMRAAEHLYWPAVAQRYLALGRVLAVSRSGGLRAASRQR